MILVVGWPSPYLQPSEFLSLYILFSWAFHGELGEVTSSISHQIPGEMKLVAYDCRKVWLTWIYIIHGVDSPFKCLRVVPPWAMPGFRHSHLTSYYFSSMTATCSQTIIMASCTFHTPWDLGSCMCWLFFWNEYFHSIFISPHITHNRYLTPYTNSLQFSPASQNWPLFLYA